MARLSKTQILEKVKNPPSKGSDSEIFYCILHDKRCAFHTEPTQNLKTIPYFTDYIKWVGEILDQKKLEVFKSLMKLPIETVDFFDGVFKELKKVFDGQNRTINYEFVQPNLVSDFDKYLALKKDSEFWQGKAFNAMKSAINSIMVVDMPMLETDDEGNQIQETLYPEPYYYLLDIENVLDFEMDDMGKFTWILFKGDEKNEYYFFDDVSFNCLLLDDTQVIISFTEIPHDLTYCPARNFWSTPFNTDSKIQKRAPISTSLTKADWLLFTYIMMKHVGLYAGFPIYVMYEQRCNYKDDDGNACDGSGRIGYQMRIPGNGSLPETFRESYKDCPSCKNKKLLGAGTVLTAPARSDKDDPDLLNGVKVIPAEKITLDYLSQSTQDQENTLIWRIAGTVENVNKAAMNELQIASGYESRLTVLLNIAENFEKANKWIIDTVAKLRYGKEFISSNVSYGNLFYLYTIDDLVTSFSDAKKTGIAGYELSNQMDQIIETKYQNNPEMIERCKILKAIEPWPHYTITEMLDVSKLTDLSDRLLNLKFGFDDYITRFEVEFTNIVNFMPLADPKVKLQFIKEKLLSYVDSDLKDIRAELATLPNSGVPRGAIRYSEPINFSSTATTAPGSGASGAPPGGSPGQK